jgi:DNA-binding NarL/FixJ family response regulator
MGLRTLIVEDESDWSAMFRDILAGSDDFEVAFIAANAREARHAIETERFNVALIDIGLPDGSGIDLLALLAECQPEADAMICTVFEDEATVLKAIQAGARGYVLKQDAARNLLPVLQQMKAGGAPLSPRIAQHILNHFWPPSETGAGDFTPREMDVLRQVSGGLTLKQAARELGVAESTVRTHVKNLYSKLGVKSRGAALLEASRRRLI